MDVDMREIYLSFLSAHYHGPFKWRITTRGCGCLKIKRIDVNLFEVKYDLLALDSGRAH